MGRARVSKFSNVQQSSAKLRISLESCAAALLEDSTISARTRSLVSYIQQHKPHTARLDYVRQEQITHNAAASADDEPPPAKYTVHAAHDCARVFEFDE